MSIRATVFEIIEFKSLEDNGRVLQDSWTKSYYKLLRLIHAEYSYKISLEKFNSDRIRVSGVGMVIENQG